MPIVCPPFLVCLRASGHTGNNAQKKDTVRGLSSENRAQKKDTRVFFWRMSMFELFFKPNGANKA